MKVKFADSALRHLKPHRVKYDVHDPEDTGPPIWDKGSTGHAPARTLGWRRSHELILFASKGGKRFSTVTSDVIRVPNVRDKGHAAEKPTELYVELLKRSCLPRDRVLDPCCGSGTIFQAARETYTTATGIECDEKAHGLALTKLQGAAEDEMLAAE